MAEEKTVMVVDDEETIVNILTETLDMAGFETIGQTSSPAALAEFRENYSRIDLVVTDQTMPEISGLKLAEEIQKIKPGTPIILITGFMEMTAEQLWEKGIKAFLQKPLSLKNFMEAVKSLIAAE